MHYSITLSFLLLSIYTTRWSISATPLYLPSSQTVTYKTPSEPVAGHSRPFLRRDLPRTFSGVPFLQVLGAGWTAASYENYFMYPSEDLDKLLADFYHSIVTMSMAMTASNTPPAPYGGIFKNEALELAFDTTGNPIPWSLLRAFADFMLLTTDRGYSCTYTMWLTHVASGQAIRFILRLGQGVLALPP